MIKKKRVLITGAGGFLGVELCAKFSKLNYDLICLEKNKSKIKFLRKKLLKFKNDKLFFLVDITNEEKIKKLFNNLKKKKYYIDIIINNAANNPVVKKTKKIRLMDIDNWKKDLDVGLMGAFIVTKTFANCMKKEKGGSIINIGSDLSVLSPNHDIYIYVMIWGQNT